MFLLMASRPSGNELNYISDYDKTIIQPAIITIKKFYLSSSSLTPAAVPGSLRIPSPFLVVFLLISHMR